MDRYCLIHDALVPEAEACVSIQDRGFLYGDGLFETLRVYAGHPYRLGDHERRLAASARFLGLPLPDRDWALDLARVLEANGLADASVRITLSRGPKPAGPRPNAEALRPTAPTLLVQARPLRSGLAEVARHGIAAALTPWPGRCKRSPLHQHKTLSYLSSILTLGETNPGVEPLLWNGHGELAEGATSNLFWVRDGTVRTPHLECGCLPGVTRGVVLELARGAGLAVSEGFYPTAELAEADEAFVTNSVLEVAPLVRLDGRAIGVGVPGPVTRQLQEAYRRDVAEARVRG